MTIKRHVSVECDGITPDGEACMSTFTDGGNAAFARRRARRQGWKVALAGGRDLCPRRHRHK